MKKCDYVGEEKKFPQFSQGSCLGLQSNWEDDRLIGENMQIYLIKNLNDKLASRNLEPRKQKNFCYA